MSLFTFLLSSRHHFQCAGNFQGVPDDGSAFGEDSLLLEPRTVPS